MELIIKVLVAIIGLVGGASSECGSPRRLEPLYQWSVLTYNTQSSDQPPRPNMKDNFITGIEEYGDSLFLATPRQVYVSPSTLSTIPKKNTTASPALQPYPNAQWNRLINNTTPNCNATLVSTHRTVKDKCNRLWVLDTGKILNVVGNKTQVCPPKIVVFDLKTNQMVTTTDIPDSALRENSNPFDLVLDDVITVPGPAPRTNSSCDNVFAYIADSTAPAIIVHDFRKKDFYRFDHPFMYPDPDVPNLTLERETFTAFFGVIGMDVAGNGSSRNLYLSPFASEKVFKIATSVLQQYRNITDASQIPINQAFDPDSPGIPIVTDVSTDCILFNPIYDHSISAWNPKTQRQSVLAKDRNLSVVFDFIEDGNNTTTTYFIQGRLQKFILHEVSNNEINQRVMKLIKR